MGTKVCMNVVCGVASSIEWREGWVLRSGELANLCDKCGLAFEQMVFCDLFHSKDSGWRECASCGKRLHCGCIASRSLFELLDTGGVNCISCTRSSGLHSITSDEKPNGFGTVDNVGIHQPSAVGDQIDGITVAKLTQPGDISDGSGLKHLLQSHNSDVNGVCGQKKQDEVFHYLGESGNTCISNLNQASIRLSQTGKPDICKNNVALYDPMVQTNLSMTLGAPSGSIHHVPVAAVEEREQSEGSSGIQHGPKSRHLLPKPPKSALATGLEPNICRAPQIRVARPPAEGRGRSQLLPRYWPRTTDQELRQISGDSNSTIVPLFEKVLSASDAGRIGRLVLPKACAEAYFPPLSQAEGLPLRIQDVKGKEWVFQFRFWPNNNSRMYVLEGVTPCIQSMQLQAGDTVTFSRMDPEGKLIMGFRKAVNSLTMQDSRLSANPNSNHSSETFFSGVMENIPIISGYSGLLQSLRGSTDPHLNALTKHLSANGNNNLLKTEKHEDRMVEHSLLPMLTPERKRSRNIGLKSKRLLIDSQDSLELRLTWEEAQGLLRPPPSTEASIVMVEDHEFEEYDEPPVFGKRSIFTVRTSGGQEQWAQCDNCSKWRRLPVDILLPSKWTCAENAWDQSRCSCSAPDELSPSELENLLRMNKEFKKRRTALSHRPTQVQEPSGLDALANAAVIGENVSDPDAASTAATTKHPRHRPGCSCIVCIQPPSGKGKHKPTCTCNVCMTVKRRFKTLMMRKKKRQSERDNEIAQHNNQHIWRLKDAEAEAESASRHLSSSSLMESSETEARLAIEPESGTRCSSLPNKMAESGKGQIDLNCDPGREEDLRVGTSNMSMMSLLQVASLPLHTYLKQNGLTSLVSEQQSNSATNLLAQAGVETEGLPQEEECHPASKARETESRGNEETLPPDQSQNDPV